MASDSEACSSRCSALAYTSYVHADRSPLKAARPHRDTEKIIDQSGVPYALRRNNLYTEISRRASDKPLQQASCWEARPKVGLPAPRAATTLRQPPRC